MKRLLLVVIAMAALSLLPVRAHAVCLISGAEVARVEYNAAISLATIFVRSTSIGAASFFATTNNINFIVLASNAVHTRTKVNVRGSAAACPASGNIGTVNFFGVDVN